MNRVTSWRSSAASIDNSPKRKRRLALIVVGTALAVGTVIARRRGYSVGGNTVVRCRKGHLFTTIWIPGASIKAIRLGWARLQRCPVGNHWSLVTPVRNADLSEDERVFAKAHHDIRVP